MRGLSGYFPDCADLNLRSTACTAGEPKTSDGGLAPALSKAATVSPKSALSASPHLWSSIEVALDESEWFVLVASPDAAPSRLVNRELEYWLARKLGIDGDVRVWDASTFAARSASLGASVGSDWIVVRHAADFVGTVVSDGSVKFWDLATGQDSTCLRLVAQCV